MRLLFSLAVQTKPVSLSLLLITIAPGRCPISLPHRQISNNDSRLIVVFVIYYAHILMSISCCHPFIDEGIIAWNAY
jgi:hypothetical protein